MQWGRKDYNSGTGTICPVLAADQALREWTRSVPRGALPGLRSDTQRGARPIRDGRLQRRSGSGGLGLLEDPVDLVDLVEQLLRLGGIEPALRAGCPGELGGLIEEGVQLGVLLEVRGL